MLCRSTQRGPDGERRGETKSTRAGDQKHAQSMLDRDTNSRRPMSDQRQGRNACDQRKEPRGNSIRQPLVMTSRQASFLEELQQAAKRAGFEDGGRFDNHVAVKIHGAAEEAIAGDSTDGNTFAREDLLINGGASLNKDRIDGETFSRANLQTITDSDFSAGDLYGASRRISRNGFRQQCGQLIESLGGSMFSGGFKPAAKRDHHEDRCTDFEVNRFGSSQHIHDGDHISRRDAGGDQQVGRENALPPTDDGVLQQRNSQQTQHGQAEDHAEPAKDIE